MREWILRHRLSVCLWALAAIALAVILVQVDRGTSWLEALTYPLFNVPFWFAIAYLGLQSYKKRQSALASRGLIFAYLRYPGSTPGSLSDLWAGGSVSCSPRQIIFQEFMNDTEVPLGRPKKLKVMSFSERRPAESMRQAVHPMPGMAILTLTRIDGDVEIAADVSDLEKLQQDVFGANASADGDRS